MNDVTLMLERMGTDASAARDLLPLLYDELHTMAKRQFASQRADHTLQPTVLVHEAFIKMLGGSNAQFANRKHFFAVAAIAMRQILVNHAREKSAEKRGGGKKAAEYDDNLVSVDDAPTLDVLALNEALEKLQAIDERKHKVVELRFFAGLTVPEVAEVLDVSVTTIESEWRAARAWLVMQLGEQKD
ncbi:MAG: ECF-type sigma factor [Tepidisphaeraceae bacterium]